MMPLEQISRDELENVCETLVPGFRAAGAVEYVQAALASGPEEWVQAAAGLIAELRIGNDDPMPAGARALPGFSLLRGLSIEAYYSGYLAPGAPGPDAWSLIRFSTPTTQREHRSYDYLPGLA